MQRIVAAPVELDRQSATRFAAELEAFDASADLLIDLRHVRYADSGALSVLLAVYRRHIAARSYVVLMHPQPLVRRVLEATGLADVLVVPAL